MTRKTKVPLYAIAAILVFAALSLLGGSLPGFLISGSPLTIEGRAPIVAESAPATSSWEHYGGDAGGQRHAEAAQIKTENVESLEPAWTYSTGDMAKRGDLMWLTATEATPILVLGKLIFCTPFNEIIALDPGTGAEIWRFDPYAPTDQYPANLHVCRGVSTHTRSDGGQICPTRIVMGTNNGLLIAVDAETGAPCADFGEAGRVTVDPGKALLWPGEFHITSPPAVAGDTLILGSSISDNERVDAPAGTVRAYDAITGQMRWIFDPIPREAPEPGAPIPGAANVWAPMSVDVQRGLVFLPTSSASPDYFGGGRAGDNRHANSIVALDAASGALVWAYQLVHHDVWDYDLPAQPGLYTITTESGPRDVVAQVTKTGHVFVLDRETGAPVLPIEERPVPGRAEAGEGLSPTQPFPAITPAIVPSNLSADDAFGITWFDRQQCKSRIGAVWSGGLFAAPTLQGTLLYPFAGGGANWGGAAYDASRNLLVVNMSNIAHVIRLIPAETAPAMEETRPDIEVHRQIGAPFAVTREVLWSSLALPCSPPPYGVIAGVDLASGQIVWRQTLGTTEEVLAGVSIPLGTPNLGGPITTAGGLVFIGAAMDDYLRAFDTETGREVWKGKLPAGGQATPMSYTWQGRQYVVIYSGGHGLMGTTLGDQVTAFALPQ